MSSTEHLRERLRSWLRSHRVRPVRTPEGESDVARDTGVARSRAHGGPPPEGEVSDAATTTGTADNGLFVGRVAGDDLGYAGETGAEARARSESSDEEPEARRPDTRGLR